MLTSYRWSPAIISKKLEGIYEYKIVSAECIYQYIYRQKKEKGVDYTHYLRVGRKNRQKRTCIRKRRGIIKDRVFIDERPKEVEARQRIGDWEIDLIEGKNKKSYLLVMVERMSRYVILQKLHSKNALHCSNAIIRSLQPFVSIGWVKTLTFDNGKEFALHTRIQNVLQVPTYFTHPYSAWEKGTCENTNGRLRMFLPKKSDFTLLKPPQIYYIQECINNRPMKVLDYLSPNQFLLKKLSTKILPKLSNLPPVEG
ncbi:MAG: hypothetical protein KatS3mg027_0200 [Bacteroidia bacterium]|nr:MAG: hypothetical protein KatS3mg027_0200 [Bacteroidia bacterium]